MTSSNPPILSVPLSERERLEELASLGIMETPAEGVYDGLAEIAAALFDMPFAAVSLIDAHRQWFKSHVGMPFCETRREHAFCSHTILSTRTAVAEDTTLDPRFAGIPYVVGEPYIRFYAGAPLVTSRGECVGTVCVLDVKPRQLTSRQLRLLERLARQTVELMEAGRLVNAMASVTEPPSPRA